MFINQLESDRFGAAAARPSSFIIHHFRVARAPNSRKLQSDFFPFLACRSMDEFFSIQFEVNNKENPIIVDRELLRKQN